MARKAMPWLRLYTELPSDRKIRRLRKGEHKWLYVCVLVLARQSPQPGRLLISDRSRVDLEDIADLSGCDVRTCKAAVDAMVTHGLLTLDDSGVWVVPAWDARQFASDDVSARSRKSRKQQAKNVACNGDATLQDRSEPVACNGPETETEEDPELPPNAPLDANAVASLDGADEFIHGVAAQGGF